MTSTELDEIDLEEQPSLVDCPTDSSGQEDIARACPGTNESTQCSRILMKRFVLALLLVGFIVFVIVDSSTTGYLRNAINVLLDWIKENPVSGWFVLSIVYCLATILFIPGSILTLGAGFVFGHGFHLGVGIVLGTLSVFLGASAGAMVSFLLGRYLLRDWVLGMTKKYAIVEALDVALHEKGFRIMTLLRLSPIVPFNALNYIAGATSISVRDFLLSLFGILPGTVLYVFLGASAGSLAESVNSGASKTTGILIIVGGVVLSVGAIFLASYYAKKELYKIVAQRQESQGVPLHSLEDTGREHSSNVVESQEYPIVDCGDKLLLIDTNHPTTRLDTLH